MVFLILSSTIVLYQFLCDFFLAQLRNNIPCYLTDISCGLPCDRMLKCGMHKCKRICHKGECLIDEECRQPCTILRLHCNHPCMSPCHPSLPCPTTSCSAKVGGIDILWKHSQGQDLPSVYVGIFGKRQILINRVIRINWYKLTKRSKSRVAPTAAGRLFWVCLATMLGHSAPVGIYTWPFGEGARDLPGWPCVDPKRHSIQISSEEPVDICRACAALPTCQSTDIVGAAPVWLLACRGGCDPWQWF